ncbi:MAG: LLM class flavin-dependent oxidoreductase [Candidatus Binatia bacterium]
MRAPIRFGYFLDFRNPPGSGLSFGEFYSEIFRQIEHAEQSGFDSVWLSEHHFTDDGYLAPIMPALAAVASRTRRVSIGTFVLLAPFYHPLRLAEDAAFIDVISGGRLRLGIGLGYRTEEFEVLGVPRSQRLGRTLEAIEIMRRAWTSERFSFEGKYFQFRNVRIVPRPISQPHPELLWGGMAPKAIERGAELGLSFACNLGAKEVAMYHEALRRRGKDPAAYNVVSSRPIYVADSAAQAWADIERPLMYQAEVYAKWLSEAAGSDQQWFVPETAWLQRSAVFGTPQEVTTRLRAILEKNPMTELVVVMQLPGLEPAKAMQSLQRFATDVMPALRHGT